MPEQPLTHSTKTDEAECLLRRQMARSQINSDKQESSSRVSSTARLNDIDHPLVAAMGRRVQLATGLDTSNRTGYPAERLQVSRLGQAETPPTV